MRNIINYSIKNQIKSGFTMVEILIIVPIVIIVIGIFISAIVSMTGEVLSSRGSTNLMFNIQDALNRIEQDVTISGAYLATNNITLTSPQGYNNDTTNFHNADATNGASLILNSYATSTNPYNTALNKIYVPNTPNTCISPSVAQNTPLMMNTVYFVKNNTLWRRVLAKSDYTTFGCSNPWQYASCNPSYVTGSYPFCKTQDSKLVDGIQAGGFSVEYYPGPSATISNTIAKDSAQSDAQRLTALQQNNTVVVTITANSTAAGKTVTQSGTIRATSVNNYTTGN